MAAARRLKPSFSTLAIRNSGRESPGLQIRCALELPTLRLQFAKQSTRLARRRHVRRDDIVAAQVGLAGARRLELSLRMREALSNLGIADVQVCGDADIALYGATANGGPGVVVIAGTGSVCCGVNARGRTRLGRGLGADCRRRRWWRLDRASRDYER